MMQPGKRISMAVSSRDVAFPASVGLFVLAALLFGTPRALAQDDVDDVIEPPDTVESLPVPGTGEEQRDRIVRGRVYDRVTGDGIALAPVTAYRIESLADTLGTSSGGIWSNEQGYYQLVLKPGLYDFGVAYFSYEPYRARAVRVEADTTVVDFPLSEDVVVLDSFDVVDLRLENTEQAVLTEQRESFAVLDGISSEQISRGTDSNAAEALSRVTGLTNIGGETYVRGLGDRYSSTQVNGATISSPDPNRRVVPLDLFATGLVDNIVVQKSFTPDQPGQFAGGTVDIRTKDFPGHRAWSLSASVGQNSRATGFGRTTYAGGRRDWLGYDDGTRALPDIVPEDQRVVRGGIAGGLSAEEIEAIGEAFPRSWGTRRAIADPNQSYGASYSDQAKVFGRRIGVLASGSYSHGFSQQDRTRVIPTNIQDEESTEIDVSYDLDYNERSILWGGVGNVTAELLEDTTFRFRSMYNRSAEDITLIKSGVDEQFRDSVRVTELAFVERSIQTNSFELEHPVLVGAQLEWKYSRSLADRSEPDHRKYTYEKRNDGRYALSNNDQSNLQMIFGDTNDDERVSKIDLTVPLWGESDDDSKASRVARFKGGYFRKDEDRNTLYRSFKYSVPSIGDAGRLIQEGAGIEELLTDENIGGQSAARSFRIEETTQWFDGYEGSHEIDAGYAMLDIPIRSRLRATFGVRWENSLQKVDSSNPFGVQELATASKLDTRDALPAVNLVYRVSDRTNVRAAFTETLTRPQLRELASIVFYNFEEDEYNVGNPDLKRTLIENLDLRVETYLGPTELLAVSLFRKDFENPVVQTITAGGSYLYVPQNAKDGWVRGLELEARFGLGRLSHKYRSWGLSTNFTFTDSKLNSEGLPGIQTAGNRPFDGQSPYIVNLGVHFTSVTGGTSASLLYNVFGKRLRKIAGFGQPDEYERPFHSLDAKFSLGNGLVKIGFENILDDEVEYRQGDFTTKGHRLGRKASISFNLKG